MRKISIVFAVLFMVALVSNAAFGGIIVYSTLNGVPADANGNSLVTLNPGETVAGQLWALVTGADATLTNEKLTTITGALQITGGGTFSPWTTPYAAGTANGYGPLFTAEVGSNPVDLSADGKMIGHPGLSSVSATGIIVARSVNASAGGEVGNGPYLLANFTYNTATNGDTINFLKSAASTGMYAFMIDGGTKTGSNTGTLAGYGLISSGTCTVQTVPEPATLVLLGMGALALVFVRRRK